MLVRSLDRPFLHEALASLAAQTHPSIEVVVVAARPGHGALPDRCGAHPLRLVTTDVPRPRSVAANVALDAAAGEYLLFLDDDDWLMPQHIARLVQALQDHPGTLAAYAGVALVDLQGQPLGQVLDLPFDAVRLLSGNLTPIHAVLFSARLRDAGCRFDEVLDRYEDWDFWIQMAQHTVPLHLGGISAVYRIHPSSGVHDDAGPLSLSSRRIHDKWLQQLSPARIGELMHRAWSHDELEQRLSQLQSAHDGLLRSLASQSATLDTLRADLQQQQQALLAERDRADQLDRQQAKAQAQLHGVTLAQAGLEQRLAEQTHRADALQIDLRAVHDSHSWRLTAPLRWLATRLTGRGRG